MAEGSLSVMRKSVFRPIIRCFLGIEACQGKETAEVQAGWEGWVHAGYLESTWEAWMMFVFVVSLLLAQLVGRRQALALVCTGAASSAGGLISHQKSQDCWAPGQVGWSFEQLV